MRLDSVVIDSLRNSDIPVLYEWANDLSELGYWTMRRRQWLPEDYEAHIKQVAREFGVFIVRCERDSEPVALIEVTTRELDGVAEMLLYVAPKHRRGRAWLNGMMQVIQYAFASLPLHKVIFRIFEFNRRTIHIMRSAHLKEEGRFKEIVWNGMTLPHFPGHLDCGETATGKGVQDGHPVSPGVPSAGSGRSAAA